MTVEEIKKKIEKLNEDAYPQPYDEDWCQGYERGRESAYNDCLELLGKYNPWYPYPKERPPKDGEYIVTVPFEGVEHVTYAEFEQDRWLLPTLCYNCLGYADTPIAWMELPKPYKKEIE